MLRIATETKLSPEEAIKQAIEFFSGNYGLEVKDQEPTHVYLEGGGGGVEIATKTQDNKTSVEIVSREWDFQVKEFIRKIH